MNDLTYQELVRFLKDRQHAFKQVTEAETMISIIIKEQIKDCGAEAVVTWLYEQDPERETSWPAVDNFFYDILHAIRGRSKITKGSLAWTLCNAADQVSKRQRAG